MLVERSAWRFFFFAQQLNPRSPEPVSPKKHLKLKSFKKCFSYRQIFALTATIPSYCCLPASCAPIIPSFCLPSVHGSPSICLPSSLHPVPPFFVCLPSSCLSSFCFSSCLLPPSWHPQAQLSPALQPNSSKSFKVSALRPFQCFGCASSQAPIPAQTR